MMQYQHRRARSRAARLATGPFAAAMVAVMVVTSPARAQITQLARTPIQDAPQLTFGYQCDDRFVLRNEGTAAVDLEYGLEKGSEHTKVQLGARESITLESKSKSAIELWYQGKRIATAEKDRRKCTDADNNSAMVRALDVRPSDDARSSRYGSWPYYDPFFSPYGFAGYSGLYGGPGYSRYYPAVIGYPVIVGGGGRVVRGGGRRGR